jgi:hypothetical protein
MKKIPLTNSKKKATINDWNYPLIAQFQWRLRPASGGKLYAILPDGQPLGSDDTVVAEINGQTVGMGMLVMFPELAEGAASAN